MKVDIAFTFTEIRIKQELNNNMRVPSLAHMIQVLAFTAKFCYTHLVGKHAFPLTGFVCESTHVIILIKVVTPFLNYRDLDQTSLGQA